MTTGRYGLARRHSEQPLYLGRDGHPTNAINLMRRFPTPAQARTWLHYQIPDFADGWYVTELPEVASSRRDTSQDRCCKCGRFVRWGGWDKSTSFGCANPEYPEPYDPDFYCRVCAGVLYRRKLHAFRGGARHGDYRKSSAEQRAAKRCHLQWVDSGGVVDPTTLQQHQYRYITAAEAARVVPYSEWVSDPERVKQLREAESARAKNLIGLGDAEA